MVYLQCSLLFLSTFWLPVTYGLYDVVIPKGKAVGLEITEDKQKNPPYPCNFIQKPMDCSEVLKNGQTKNGIYRIFPRSRALKCDSIQVYCDMESDGTGWTVIQRRGDFKNPINYFSKKWNQYKVGFGDLEKEFWLGNDKIYAISNQASYSIRFDLRHTNGTVVRDQYDSFWIENEELKYRIYIDGYSGNGSDAMEEHHNQTFSTRDKDFTKKCGKESEGGWWFRNDGHCLYANLNGFNTQGGVAFDKGIHWRAFTEYKMSLAYTEIKIRTTPLN